MASGEAVLVEGGPPGTHLFVVREGIVELTRSDVLVTVVGSGDIFGHPTLLTGLPPEFTVQARSDALLYCIPRDVAVEPSLAPRRGALARRQPPRTAHPGGALHERPARRCAPCP